MLTDAKSFLSHYKYCAFTCPPSICKVRKMRENTVCNIAFLSIDHLMWETSIFKRHTTRNRGVGSNGNRGYLLSPPNLDRISNFHLDHSFDPKDFPTSKIEFKKLSPPKFKTFRCHYKKKRERKKNKKECESQCNQWRSCFLEKLPLPSYQS